MMNCNRPQIFNQVGLVLNVAFAFFMLEITVVCNKRESPLIKTMSHNVELVVSAVVQLVSYGFSCSMLFVANMEVCVGTL